MFSFDDVIMTRVRGEAWPQFGYHHPFLIAWCKHMSGLPRTLWTHVTGGNFHRFSEATDRKMPVVEAVSGDCERVHGIIHYTRLNHCQNQAETHYPNDLRMELKSKINKAIAEIQSPTMISSYGVEVLLPWKLLTLTLYVLIFFRGNINIYLHFVLFLHIDTTHVVEILPQIRQ